MRRKGEISPAEIDRRFPHQVAIPAAAITANFDAVQSWLAERSTAPRRRNVVGLDDEWWTIVAFSDHSDAAAFLKRFGGVGYDPANRDPAVWQRWKRPIVRR